MKSKNKKNVSDTTRYRKTREKPEITVVKLPDGRLRFFGIGPAALWLGCKGPSLGMVLRGVPGRGNRIRSMVSEHYPDILKQIEKKA